MDNFTNREETIVATLGNPSRTSWGAIWAGLFTFIAIWSVFGMLGEAIFATSANPNAAQPVGGMSVGMGIWCIVLTIVAMYVAGLVTAYLGNVFDRTARIMHGMAMFGLSVFAIALMVVLGGSAISGNAGAAGATTNLHSLYMWSVFSEVGWASFIALFLGWLAAIGGAAQGLVRGAVEESTIRQTRRAA